MSSTTFQCPKCGGTFQTQQQLQEHAAREHSAPQEQSYRCAACGGTFATQEQLQGHARQEHAG